MDLATKLKLDKMHEDIWMINSKVDLIIQALYVGKEIAKPEIGVSVTANEEEQLSFTGFQKKR